MALKFVGIDPETGTGQSPTVWVDEKNHEIVIQGWKPSAALFAECAATTVPGHAVGIPESEAVIRARIVSEPVTDYIRYEHVLTAVNLYSGEEVRWLPRRSASRIALPGNDFWCLDGRYVRLNHFTGSGDGAAEPFEDSEDPALAELCASAFEAVWEIATPHNQFTI